MGRYLSVNLPGRNYLTICEVKAFRGNCKRSPVTGGSITLKGRPTAQSSTGHGGSSSRAVDGNTNSQWGGRSCTHTNNDPSAWWRVDMGKKYCVGRVVLYNRADCCRNRLNRAMVRVGPSSNPKVNKVCKGRATSGLTSTLTCNLNGRYLSVNLAGRDYLTLCEVRAYRGKCTGAPSGGLIPLKGKRTQQSSTAHSGSSNRAVDGNTNGQWGGRSCTHTHSNPAAWWRVDMGKKYCVGRVVLYNRADCCRQRLNRAMVRVGGNSNHITNKVCKGRATSGSTSTLMCNLEGRYLSVNLQGKDYLTLCEVKAYRGKCGGVAGGLIPLKGKRTQQSSTAHSGSSNRAVDGNTNGQWGGRSCTHTHSNPSAWWRVDMGKKYCVGRVVLYNRADCCRQRLNRAMVRVGGSSNYRANKVCKGRATSGSTSTLTCNLQGRYLSVNLQGKDYLTLCEVKAYRGTCGEVQTGGPDVIVPVPDRNLLRGKPTRQCSTIHGGTSNRAVDGKVSGQWGSRSCTHTQSSQGAWWRVDMGRSQCVGKVVLYNRADCCRNRLNGAMVRVGDSSNHIANRICRGRYPSAIRCDLKGRYLSVNLQGRNYLTLCEVKAFRGKCTGKPPGNWIVLRGKPTAQSSTAHSGHSNRAVDGNTSGQWGSRSCTHTHLNQAAWWRVDMLKNECVGKVVLYNRADCCKNRLNGAVVRVGGSSNHRINSMCSGRYPATISCNRRGRFLSVNLPGRNYLTLCEVKVFRGKCKRTGGNKNLLLGRPTAQSSTGHGGSSGRAVDGNISGQWGSRSCTHTNSDLRAWWRVDMGKIQCVGRVVVHNRVDCCGSRLQNAIVRVGRNGHVIANTECKGRLTRGSKSIITCNLEGRYLSVNLPGRNALTLCEVQAYRGKCTVKPPTGLLPLKGRPTAQSSTGHGGSSSRAVDGNTNGQWGSRSCTHTNSNPGAWWRVDMGKNYCVGRVVVFNRADCCGTRLNGALVRVGGSSNHRANKVCKGRANAGLKSTLTCNLIGRYLSVNLPGKNALTLCEVRAYRGKCTVKPPTGLVPLKGRPTKQSSTTHGGSSNRAVDGNTNGQWGGRSCTHTGGDQGAWWRVDMGKNLCVGRVVLYNRADCCRNRINSAMVRVGPSSNHKANKVCKGRATSGLTSTLTCNQNGRYLSVNLPGKNVLTLCEVKAYYGKCTAPPAGGLVPLKGKRTQQSSTAHGGSSSRAVDGNTSGQWGSRSCTHTHNNPAAWWRVDMGKKYCVGRVVLYNRADCCKHRLRGAIVRVGNSKNHKVNTVCKGRGSDRSTSTITCDKNGRYLSVNLPGKDYLTLCEVKAYVGKCIDGHTGGPDTKDPDANVKPCFCRAFGDPHFMSCDGRRFDFQGKCVYTTAEVCKSGAGPYFKLEQRNQPWRWNKLASTTKELHLYLGSKLGTYDTEVRLLQKHKIVIRNDNGQLIRKHPPVRHKLFNIDTSGSNLVLTLTDAKDFKLTWNGRYNWMFNIPGRYKRRICGLCGKWDGIRSNDFTLPNGRVTTNPNIFGNAYLSKNFEETPGQCKEKKTVTNFCSDNKHKKEAESSCRILSDKNGPLSACFNIRGLDRQAFIKGCKEDVCAALSQNKATTIHCSSIGEFVELCQKQRRIKPWRVKARCPMKCAANQHYELYTSPCQLTCTGRLTGKSCNKKTESCVCNKGYRLSGTKCVKQKDCGCLNNNAYYTSGEIVVRNNCRRKCSCKSGKFSCIKYKCGKNKQCATLDGIQECYDVAAFVIPPSTGHFTWKFVALPRGRFKLFFSLNAKRGCVHIVLSKLNKDNANTYEIVLDGKVNNKIQSAISRKGKPQVINPRVPILKPNRFTHFKLTWNRGTIRLYKDNHDGPFLQYTDKTPIDVRYFGIRIGTRSSGRIKVFGLPLRPDNEEQEGELIPLDPEAGVWNMLKGKPTRQSSTTHNGIASRAVDGNINPQWKLNSCTHTKSEKGAWWMVDMTKIECVSKVALYNRVDCCNKRLTGAIVRIGDNRIHMSNRACEGTATEHKTSNFKCNLRGRYLSVNLPKQKAQPLTLCEVKAFRGTTCKGKRVRGWNILKGKPTKQISTAHKGDSSRAVDGNISTQWKSNSCTHTSKQKGAWWRVDLGKTLCVGRVELFNRADCCSNRLNGAIVRVGKNKKHLSNKACKGRFPSKTRCDLKGRYLSVNLPKTVTNYLTLCEVRAFLGNCKEDPKFPIKNGAKMYYVSNTAKTYKAAEADCVQRGGHLASITSEKINAFIKNLAVKSRSNLWIGFNDINKERTFTWLNGQKPCFTKWQTGEPNDWNSGRPGEDCAEMYQSGRWNDLACSAQRKYICEKD